MEEFLDESFVEYMKMKLPALVQAMLTLAANAPEWQVISPQIPASKHGAGCMCFGAQQHRCQALIVHDHLRLLASQWQTLRMQEHVISVPKLPGHLSRPLTFSRRLSGPAQAP